MDKEAIAVGIGIKKQRRFQNHL